MIRNIQSKLQQNSIDPLQLKKEMAAVEIRKFNRQAIFNKRRFPQRQIHRFTYVECQSSQEEEMQLSGLVIDTGFQKELNKIMAKQYSQEKLPQLILWLQSQQILELYEAVIGIRKLFTTRKPPIGKMLVMKADVTLMELVRHESPQVQMEACWILTNIACATGEECNTLLRNGIIPTFILALASEHRQVVEQAVWGLRNMACQSKKIRRIIADAEGLDILHIVSSKFDDEKMLDWTCSAIATICRDLPQDIIKTSIHLLCCMLACNCITNKQTIQECLSSISQYCKYDISEEDGELLLKSNIQAKLVELIARHKSKVLERNEEDVVLTVTCLEIIHGMIYANIQSVDAFQELGIIGYAQIMVRDDDQRIQVQMVSILTNFVMRSEECFMIVLHQETIFTSLLETLMDNDTTCELKLKIFGFFQSIGQNCGTFHVQQFYAETDILQIAVQLLRSEQQSTILQALTHLSSMLIRSEDHDTEQLICSDLQKKNGVIMLTRLTHHQNKEIQYKSHKILSRFYDTDSLDIFV